MLLISFQLLLEVSEFVFKLLAYLSLFMAIQPLGFKTMQFAVNFLHALFKYLPFKLREF